MLDMLHPAAAFRRRPPARRVNQNPPHDLCAQGEKVSAIVPVDAFDVDQTNVRFVDECRGLQRVAGALVPHVPVRQTAQLLVDERGEAIECREITTVPSLEQKRDVNRVGHNAHRRTALRL